MTYSLHVSLLLQAQIRDEENLYKYLNVSIPVLQEKIIHEGKFV